MNIGCFFSVLCLTSSCRTYAGSKMPKINLYRESAKSILVMKKKTQPLSLSARALRTAFDWVRVKRFRIHSANAWIKAFNFQLDMEWINNVSTTPVIECVRIDINLFNKNNYWLLLPQLSTLRHANRRTRRRSKWKEDIITQSCNQTATKSWKIDF